MDKSTYDIVVVGTGPAGLSVAIEASKNNLSCLMIDKGSLLNTIRRYPTYAVFFSTSELLELANIPFPTISKQPTRQEALRYYSKLVAYFNLKFSLYNTVENIVKQGDNFLIETTKGVISAKKVVVAIGYFDKHNRLGVKGENLEHVKYFYDEPYPYVGQEVAIIGGSNSAGEAALDLYRNGVKVSIIHRGKELYQKMKYWLLPDLENRITEGAIDGYFNSEVTEIEKGIVHIKNPKGKKTIKADFVFALIGYHPDVEFLRKIGVNFNKETYVPEYNEGTLESNLEGVYLAGTVIAGKNTSQIFIENSRHHGKLIVENIIQKSA